MALACRLALRGKGKAKPNPMVGAVLVKDGRIIGSGYHRKSGSAHAEVVAVENATEDITGAVLYVNLEPCAHQGLTPPCVDLILRKKISRVVIGTRDPNPLVNGKSIATLREHGIETECGVLEEECRRLNEVFFKFMETGKPFVTLKAATSLDGKIACHTGESEWISCPASRKMVHRLRRLADAVLVGIGTVLKDDPQLTARGVPGSGNPLRVVMDSTLRVPLVATVLKAEARTMVATTEQAPRDRIRLLQEKGIEVQVFPGDRKGHVPLEALLLRLGELAVQHVLLEGGSGLFTSAWDEGQVDKFMLFIAPVLLGGSHAPGIFGGTGCDRPSQGQAVRHLRASRSDRDIVLEGYPAGSLLGDGY